MIYKSVLILFQFLIWFFWLLSGLSFAQKIDENQLLKDIQYLSSDKLEGRKTLSEGSLLAREYIKERFRSLGLNSQYSDYTQFFGFENQKDSKVYENAANIISIIPGKQSEKIVVVVAHYDHIGKVGEVIYNGADDNASGTAGLLALADFFSKCRPLHSFMFVALDAEEMGLHGARALIEDFPFPLSQVLLNINMDMISRNENNELFAVGSHHYPHLKPILERVAKNRSPLLRFGHDTSGKDDWTFSSDHALFHQEKIPFVYFGVEDHKDYHKPTDTYENIQPGFFADAIQLILDCLIALDKEIGE